MSSHAAADTKATYPAFQGEPHYIEGYRPCSYDSPHSSLHRGVTWLGMGLVLSSVIGIGTWVFGFGANSVGSQENWKVLVAVGFSYMFFAWFVGAALIHVGRAEFRKYKARTGRTS